MPATTGEVRYTGTLFGTAPYAADPTYAKEKVADGDFTTFYAGGSGEDYIGYDLGVAVVPTEIRFTPRVQYEFEGAGYLFQGSNTGENAGYSTLATLGDFTFPSRHLTVIPVGGSTPYRYLRILPNTIYSDIAEFWVIGSWVSGITAQALAPTPSPAGGRYAATQSVTLSSRTTSAAIHYTTDGSTPSVGGGSTTLYTGAISISTTTTLKAIAVDANLTTSDVASWYFRIPGTLVPGETWQDVTTGEHISAHDGCVVYSGGYYWWFGGDRRTGETTNDVNGIGINLYRSTDLMNWTAMGIVLHVAAVTALDGSVNNLYRSHVIYNASTAKWVMWGHAGNSLVFTTAKQFVATADAPSGPWTAVACARPIGGTETSADVSIFKDDNNNAYVVYASNDNTDINIAQLNSSYTATTGTSTNIYHYPDTTLFQREAPHIWKVGSVYFLMTSRVGGWTSTATAYSTASNILGPWSAQANPFQASGSADNTISYDSQCDSIFQSQAGQWIYMGDRWTSLTRIGDSTYVFQPITFPTSTTMSISYNAAFTPDVPSSAPASTSFKRGRGSRFL